MNLEKINESLAKRYSAPLKDCYNRRILFWYDEEAEFTDDLDELDLGDVILLIVDNNYFEIKHILEVEDTASNYLIYKPGPRPDDLDNWLLDIELYSEIFSADRASIVMEELGMDDLNLKPLIKSNITFFENKQRMQALQKLETHLTTEHSFQMALLAVSCNCKMVDMETIMLHVFQAESSEEENTCFQQIEKYPGTRFFWETVKDFCGYESDAPSIKKLFHSLIMTRTCSQVKNVKAEDFGRYRLPKIHNINVFLDHWRNHKEFAKIYSYLAGVTFHELEIQKWAEQKSSQECMDADTFKIFDQIIILHIVNRLIDHQEDFDEWLGWMNQRKHFHWYEDYEKIYKALEAAIFLFRFKKNLEGHIAKQTPADMVSRYAHDYFKADLYYRHFYYNYDQIEYDILRKLAPEIDNLYCNWFLENLSDTWGGVVEENVLNHWNIEGITNQTDFYRRYVSPSITKNDREKIYIIISDALRYEVAYELNNKLLSLTGDSLLEYMLASIPSYTQLGMASLLPKNSIELDGENIKVGGILTNSLDGRKKVLQQKYERSTVLCLKDFLDMHRDEAREKTRNQRIVYIYHNTIDATADKQETEHKTFEAVNDAIDEIVRAAQKIISSYTLAARTINIPSPGKVKEIQIITVILKTEITKYDILSAIDKAIPSPIIFVLSYQNKLRYVAAYKRQSEADKNKMVLGSYMESGWMTEDTKTKPLPTALDMDSLYALLLKNLVPFPSTKQEPLESFMERVEKVKIIQRDVSQLEKRLNNEKQFNRKVEINSEIKTHKKTIEQLKKQRWIS